MNEITSLYIHIPFCISKCKYCDFFSIPCSNKNHNNFIPDNYILALCNEIIYRLTYFNVSKLETIYIGGGTPSLLSPEQLDKIFYTINSIVPINFNECEITIEANPDDINDDLIHSWNNNHINRISLGIQSFDDNALAYVSRRASAKVNKIGLERIRGQWSGILSVDLICGLPKQNKESFKSDLELLLNYKPEHISMYSLTIEDETPLGKELNNGVLDYNFDFADELWLLSKEYLKKNGYIHYEVSNFCLPGYECKHNLKYWNHQCYIGVGSGGAGSVYEKNGSGLRWTNIQNISKYIDFWISGGKNMSTKLVELKENISIKTSKFEFFMMGMRKLEGIKSSDYEKIFGEKIPAKIENIIKKWNDKGLCNICKVNDDIIYSLGHEGIIFLNKFLEEIIDI